MSRTFSKAIGRSWLYLSIAGFTFFAAFPFAWMAITVFKRILDLYNIHNNPFLFNLPPTMENIRLLFRETLFTRWLANTAFVGAFVVLITLLAAVPAGYSLARLARGWGQKFGIGIFLTYLVPPSLLFIPLARVVSTLHLQDRFWALILVYPSFTIPFCTWLLMGFFKSVPAELEEAAMVDGCSRLGALRRVVLPISVAGLLTVVVFAFSPSIQKFVYALTFISPSSPNNVSGGGPTYPVPVGVDYWGSRIGGALCAS